MTPGTDVVAGFYERHPYPPAIEELAPVVDAVGADRRRVEYHRVWPTLAYREDLTILIAGCGTSQAAKWALRHPQARVVGIDVSSAGIEAHQRLARRHGLDNLELHQLSIERVHQLGEAFDLVVCTGVLHHLADPAVGLAALGDVLAPEGAIRLMVYATYGRTGVSMMQEYCRRLGVGTSDAEMEDLVAALRELPDGHPLRYLLRRAPDFQNDDALADALLNPRERSYSVPEVFGLVDGCGLRFGRWVRQAPYLPQCGSVSETPHAKRIAVLDAPEQYAAVELYRGTITRHSLVLYRGEASDILTHPTWTDSASLDFVPLRPGTVMVVKERLPAGVAAALLNRAHSHPDLVMFVDERQLRVFEAVDGGRTIGDLGGDEDIAFFQKLWRHDLIVVDASGGD